ncbi:MAG: hypothetical protein LE169_05680 [Endomicrobium sp.]|nr:hypothetical protein [Endomicrobium sp.]
MKRLISAVLTLLLISGCVVPPRQLSKSDAVANVIESSQFSPVPAESVEPLKAPSTHENQVWYRKYSTHIFVTGAVVLVAALAYIGWTWRNEMLDLQKKLITAIENAKKKKQE